MCLINCTDLTDIEDCNNDKTTHCYWNDDYKACYWIDNCGSAKTKEKCITHPKADLSCVWDTSDPKQDVCRAAKCYDFHNNSTNCDADDNLECLYTKDYCKDKECGDYYDEVDCHTFVGNSCVWQYGECIQAPCTQWTRSSVCIDFAFCRWHSDKKNCAKATCGELRDQAGCESFYTEKYIDSCAWGDEDEGCHVGKKCQEFTTKIGCLVGSGPCTWIDEQCKDL